MDFGAHQIVSGPRHSDRVKFSIFGIDENMFLTVYTVSEHRDGPDTI